jgi:serine protease Do
MWSHVEERLFWLRRWGIVLVVGSILCGQLTGDLRAQSAPPMQTPEALNQLSSSVEALVKKVSPSVVQVLVTGVRPLGGQGRGETSIVLGKHSGIGSGAIIDPDGYIMTNAHVVSGAHRVQVTLSSPADEAASAYSHVTSRGSTLDARVVGVSSELDLALLKVEGQGLPALKIGDYGRLRQGEIVFAFGSPIGLRNTVSMGVVSAVARQLDPDSPLVFIQTDAPVNPGNSGGPLVNVSGELVGINTFIFSQSGGNEGLGFAIPSAVVRYAYSQLRKYGHLHRGVIGIQVQTITPGLTAGLGLSRDWGVIISDVLPGSPADEAGLKVQDIVLTVNGKAIDSLPLLGISFFLINPGDNLKMVVLRGTEKLPFEVKVMGEPQDLDQLLHMADPEKNMVRKLGIVGLNVDATILQLLPHLREESGVVVVARMGGGGGADNSLVSGDIIHALNGVAVSNLESLSSALDGLKPGSDVVLQVERERRLTYLTFPMD